MKHFFVAYNEKNHKISEPLGVWGQCEGFISTLGFAKVIANKRIKYGFKNVTIFEHEGNPYDNVLKKCVKWDVIIKNKII